MEVIIRHSEPEEYEAIHAIYQQPSCYAGTLQLPFPAKATWQKRLAEPSQTFFSLIAEIDGDIVGQIGMDVFTSYRRKHVANIGMGILEGYQGKGIGSKLLEAMLELAINWLAIKRIELEVYTDNEAARALYLRHGFVHEGTAKSYAFRNGEYVDVYLMAKVV